jgi:RimJ/RimL family protein N-acetyltransferase
MLRGELVGLRARLEADVATLHAELQEDVATRSRSDSRPWRPVSPDIGNSPYAVTEPTDKATIFSVVSLADDELVGDALLWDIDTHNRSAHVGLSLFAACRGRGFGADVVKVLCDYGFRTRGLHRLQVDTLADNAAMISAATKAGFVLEGTLRRSAWVSGEFLDEVILGLLADDWR